MDNKVRKGGKKMYQALLIAPDGEYVFDYRAKTVEEVVEQLCDRGSKWFFYPFEFVVKCPAKARSRIISSPVPTLEGKSIANVIMAFKDTFKKHKEPSIELDSFLDEVVSTV